MNDSQKFEVWNNLFNLSVASLMSKGWDITTENGLKRLFEHAKTIADYGLGVSYEKCIRLNSGDYGKI